MRPPLIHHHPTDTKLYVSETTERGRRCDLYTITERGQEVLSTVHKSVATRYFGEAARAPVAARGL